MKQATNKDSRVPPGATGGQDQRDINRDAAGTSSGQDDVSGDVHRMCPCCKTVAPPAQWIALLKSCEFCADNCDGTGACVKNKCKCPGDCCAEHKAGEKCNDTITLMIGKIGEAVIEVCTACAVELAKKALLS